MIDIKELAEANCHCRDKNCNGCPFQNKKECKERKTLNTETVVEFLNMIGYNPTEKRPSAK